jgi:hypothetical protein
MLTDAPAVELQLVKTLPGFTTEDRRVVRNLTRTDTGAKSSAAAILRQEDAKRKHSFYDEMVLTCKAKNIR